VSFIGDAAVHRAHLYALGFIKPADALGAFGRVDFISGIAFFNSLVFAFRLAGAATDTIIRYLVSHFIY
jgi:hypothetical protein